MASVANKLSTPALLPWIPPGKPKESSSNVLVNKKNSGSYDLGSSIASSTVFKQPNKKKVSLNNKFWSPKKNSRKLTLGSDKERRIESLLNSSVNSQAERELLRGKILGIFDEEEEKDELEKERDTKRKKRHNSDPGNASKNRDNDGDGDGDSSVKGLKDPEGKHNHRPTTYNKDDSRTRSRSHSRSRTNNDKTHRSRSRSRSRSKKVTTLT